MISNYRTYSDSEGLSETNQRKKRKIKILFVAVIHDGDFLFHGINIVLLIF